MSLDKYVDELGKRLDVSASVIDDYEAKVSDLTARVGSLAADLLEERSQRQHAQERANEAARLSAEARDRADDLNGAIAELREEISYLEECHGRVVDQRDEARAEVVQLGRSLEEWKAALREAFDYRIKMIAQHRKALDEVVRLRTIIGELGAAEAAEPQEEIEALRPEGCPGHGVHPHNGMRCLDCPECLSSRRPT